MNIKIITFFVAALMFSLNAHAFGSGEVAETHSQEQLTSVKNVAFYSDNLKAASYKQAADKNQSSTQSMVDKQSKLFIEVCVYITIIMVYSIYWLLVPSESKNRH